MKLSVMMITYNHERFIAQALETVLAQRVNFDYEIVVGEDCSTDRTRDILMDFYNRYPDRIVPLIRDRNLGMMRNLEQTLSTCRGQYVALLEGDDYWTCMGKLQKQVDFLDSHPDYTICCHRAHVLDEGSGQAMLEGLGANETGTYPSLNSGTHTIEDLLSGNFIMTCTAMYRSSALGPLPDWFLKMGLGDWPMCALIARSGPIYLMDDVMSAYRLHPGGVWSSQTSIGRLRATTQMLTALDEHLGLKYHDTIRLTIAGFCIAAATITRKEGNRRETARLLFEFIQNGGWRAQNSRPQLRALAGYVVLGSWQGMSITTQLVQLALSKFGYKLVRANNTSDCHPSLGLSDSTGLDNRISLIKRFRIRRM